MNKDKMIEWIGTHRVGVSSRTMWNALMVPNAKNVKRDVFGYDVPYDADDFSRCYDLCKFGELTLNDLRKIEQEFPYWKPLIDEWHNLVSAYKSGNYRRVNDIIDSKRNEIIEELKKQSNENH